VATGIVCAVQRQDRGPWAGRRCLERRWGVPLLLPVWFDTGQGWLLRTLIVGRAAGRGRRFATLVETYTSILGHWSHRCAVVIIKNNAKK